jgi:hypothetical protein
MSNTTGIAGGAFLPTADYNITGQWNFVNDPTFGATASGAIVTTTGTQTLTNKTITSPTITGATLTTATLTAPTISSPVMSGPGVPQVAVIDLAGAGWHTGNGTADFLSWTVPADCVITRLIVNTTTKSNGAATADIGYTATDNHTNADNLVDAINIGGAAICQGNILPGPFGVTVDTELTCLAAASAKFVTFHALADPTGLVGKAYIFYFTL